MSRVGAAGVRTRENRTPNTDNRERLPHGVLDRLQAGDYMAGEVAAVQRTANERQLTR